MNDRVMLLVEDKLKDEELMLGGDAAGDLARSLTATSQSRSTSSKRSGS
jgi:hypothetical protein